MSTVNFDGRHHIPEFRADLVHPARAAVGRRVVVQPIIGVIERRPRDLEGRQGMIVGLWGSGNFIVRLDDITDVQNRMPGLHVPTPEWLQADRVVA